MDEITIIILIIVALGLLIFILAFCDNATDPEPESHKSKENKMNQSKICSNCGSFNEAQNNFCTKCGTALKDKKEDLPKPKNIVYCPNCGSDNIHFVTVQASQNFDKEDACCGYLCCGAPGLLCGVKDKTEARTIRKCMSCNHEF